jgi:4-amino-4-deoxy-L-arabinose transferase-like glycosyltransferase
MEKSTKLLIIKMDTLKKITLIVFIITSILRLFLTLYSHPLNGIDSTQVVSARYIAEIGKISIEMPNSRGYFEYTPFYHIVSAILYSFVNIIYPPWAFIGLKILPALAAIGIVILAYFIVRKELGEKTALIVTLFLSNIGMLLQTGSYTTLDMEACFFVVFSIFFLLRKKLFLSALMLALGFYSKFTAAIYLLVPVLFIMFYKGNCMETKVKENIKNNKNKWADSSKRFFKASLYIIYFILLITPWFIFSYIQTDNPFYPFFSDKIGCCQSVSFVSDNPRIIGQAVIARQLIATFGIANTENVNMLETYIPLYIPPKDIKHIIHIDSSLLLPGFYIFFYAVVLFFIPMFIYGFFKLYKRDRKMFWISALILFSSELLIYYILYKYFGGMATRYVIALLPILALIWVVGFESFLKSKANKTLKMFFILFAIGILIFNMLLVTASIVFVKYKFTQDYPLYDFVMDKYPRNTYFYNAVDAFTYHAHMYNTPFLDVLIDNKGIVPVQNSKTLSKIDYFSNEMPVMIKDCLVLDASFREFSFYRIENVSRCIDINTLRRNCGNTCRTVS